MLADSGQEKIHFYRISSVDRMRKAAFPFLFKLAIGWAVAFLICAVILANLFDTYIYEISSLFIGLICAVPIVAMEEWANLKNHYPHMIFTVLGMAAVPLIMYFNPVSRDDRSDPDLIQAWAVSFHCRGPRGLGDGASQGYQVRRCF